MSNGDTGKNPALYRGLVVKIVLITFVMFGFGFAMVPFYNAFCEWTGLDGRVKNSAAEELGYQVDMKREVTMEFMTSLNGEMPLVFTAERSKLKVHPGQYYTVKFYGENRTDKVIVGRAIPSIAPGQATPFLKKIQCFCFDEQTFQPHERREMPVRFVITPDIPDIMKDVTLSYTFFDITDQKSVGK